MHRAAHRLGENVLAALAHIGAVQAEAGADGVNDPWIDAAQVVIAEPHALHDTGPEVVHHHVRGLDEPQHRRPVFLRLQVERDAALVAVEAREHRVVAAIWVFADAPAGEVAPPGALDLDDVGAVVAQHLRAARAHHHLREVKHPNAFERERAGGASVRIRRHHAASGTRALPAGTSPGSAPWARICLWTARTSTSRTSMPPSSAWAAADAGGLAHRHAGRDLAADLLRLRRRRVVAPGHEDLLHAHRQQGAVGGVVVTAAANGVVEMHALHDIALGNHILAFEQAGLAHAGLGSEIHDIGALEARNVFACEFQQCLPCGPPALELRRRQVRHLHAVEAGHVRAVAPHHAGERRLQPPVLPGAADQALRLLVELGEPFRLLELEAFRFIGIDAAHARDSRDDEGALGERSAGARRDIQVAGGVDDDFGPNGLRPLLGFDDHASGPPVFDDGGLEPAVQAQLDAGLPHHVERRLLEAVRIEGCGEDDGVGLGARVEVEHAPAGPLPPERLGRPDCGVAVRFPADRRTALWRACAR